MPSAVIVFPMERRTEEGGTTLLSIEKFEWTLKAFEMSAVLHNVPPSVVNEDGRLDLGRMERQNFWGLLLIKQVLKLKTNKNLYQSSFSVEAPLLCGYILLCYRDSYISIASHASCKARY